MDTQRPTEDYCKSFTTSRGVELKIYPVPQHVLAAIKPEQPKPVRPTVDMQTKGGLQTRWAKEGDPGWEQYQEALQDWKDAQNELEQAVTYVLALKGVRIPDPVTFSPDIEELAADGLLDIPANKWLRKFMWLRLNIIGQHDEFEIMTHIQELSGVPREVVDQIRANFRDILSGKTTGTVGAGAEAPAN